MWTGHSPSLLGVYTLLSPHTAHLLNDLHEYDPATRAWTDLSAAISGTPPSPRGLHGFTSAGGKLYVHGGLGDNGMCWSGGVMVEW